MVRLRSFALSVFALFLAGCGKPSVTFVSPDASKRITLPVGIADTPELREKWLKGATTLARDTGVLFAFPEPQVLSMSMRDVPIALSVMFFSAEGEFVSGEEVEPCTNVDRCKPHTSAELAQYAVVTPPHFRDEQGIRVGWTMDVEGVRKKVNPQ